MTTKPDITTTTKSRLSSRLQRALVKEKSNASLLTPPASLRQRAERLVGQRLEKTRRIDQLKAQVAEIDKYLKIADDVSIALQSLSEQLFDEVLGYLQTKLTIALQEVLGQPIKFVADADFKRGSAVVDFSIERDGHREDIYLGQGGSVQNVVSVGLRMFALASLNENEHQRFLVLDEQDCWLRPELVPKLVSIVHQAARELKFQVIMISHHDVSLFEKYADRVYRFVPDNSAVVVKQVNGEPFENDPDD